MTDDYIYSANKAVEEFCVLVGDLLDLFRQSKNVPDKIVINQELLIYLISNDKEENIKIISRYPVFRELRIIEDDLPLDMIKVKSQPHITTELRGERSQDSLPWLVTDTFLECRTEMVATGKMSRDYARQPNAQIE
jgi:hypothetical protein